MSFLFTSAYVLLVGSALGNSFVYLVWNMWPEKFVSINAYSTFFFDLGFRRWEGGMQGVGYVPAVGRILQF